MNIIILNKYFSLIIYNKNINKIMLPWQRIKQNFLN